MGQFQKPVEKKKVIKGVMDKESAVQMFLDFSVVTLETKSQWSKAFPFWKKTKKTSNLEFYTEVIVYEIDKDIFRYENSQNIFLLTYPFSGSEGVGNPRKKK